MEREELRSYEKAFMIAEDAVGFARKLVKEGTKALQIAESIEKRIGEVGGKPAWPVNISINEVAAHYTPSIGDELTLEEGQYAKIDIGTQIDGYICDRAFTVKIGEKTDPMIEASEKALEECIKLMKPGTKVHEISEVCEKTVNGLGFNVIRNLAGHGIERYSQHAHPSIPNGRNSIQDEIKAGNVYAMEVFVTNGSGMAVDSSPIEIFQYNDDATVRLWEARKILDMARNHFDKLPFTKRWITGISSLKMDIAFAQLVEAGGLIEFPPLKEESGGMVAVAERSVIVK